MVDEITPKSPRAESLWLATTPTTEYEPLENGLDVDVAIVGGGITGLTAAINLKEAGRTVAVVESDRVVEGVTGHTTAKVTSQHGLIYDTLLSKFDEKGARQYADANEAAIEEIAGRVEANDIDCDFRRTEAYTYAKSPDDLEQIHDEVAAGQRLELPASFVEETPLPYDVPGAVRFDDQAEFHPRKYLLAILEEVLGDGSYVFEETRALDVDPVTPCRVETTRGEIVASDVVVATHFPFFDRAGYFARMHPHRAYLLAVDIEETPPDGMYYSTASPPETMRTHPVPEEDRVGGGGGAGAGSEGGVGTNGGNETTDATDGDELLIVGGQSHKPGLDGAPTSERYRRCEEFAREHFTVNSIEYRWSTMDYSPVDKVPFIGKIDPLAKNVYVGTGFKGWGMTNGTAAGMILADLIVEGVNPWADVFDPQRFTPGASVKSFLEENAKVGGSFVGDRIKSFLASIAAGQFGGRSGASGSSGSEEATGSKTVGKSKVSGDFPEPGDARVVRRTGRPLGVYHDEDGSVHAVSATCPHMACLVRWNDAERTWDCPCHGSRFSYEGDVLSGPALEGLPYREL